MIIEIRKFGGILSSRPAGKEAFASAKAYFLPALLNEITLDFSGVNVLSPSWADEFIAGLKSIYRGIKINYVNTSNESVKETLEIIEKYSK